MRRALPLALLALAAAPAGAQAAERVVDMPAKYFVPPNITTLAGDTVTWTNSDTIEHDVALIGGGFDSGIIGPGGRYSQTFSRPGHYAYRCTIHAFMAGTVDVYSFQLLGPDHPVSIGHPAILRGIAPSGTAVVRIESRAPTGTAWAPVTAVAPASDGSFRAQVRPAAPDRLSSGHGRRPEPAAAAEGRRPPRHDRQAAVRAGAMRSAPPRSPPSRARSRRSSCTRASASAGARSSTRGSGATRA